MATVYYADCDQYDNHRTGYHATPEAAIEAFWQENHFSDSERVHIRVYTRDVEVTAEVREDAAWLETQGIDSPGLAMCAGE